MEATDVALCASLPLLNTNEGKVLFRSFSKIFRGPRRSAMNIELVASLQIAENVKVSLKKGVLVVKASIIEQQKAA